MKKLSIKLRVTLLFTLIMLVIVAAVLAFLLAAGERVAAGNALDALSRVVQDSLDEIEYDDGALDIDDDLDYFTDGVYINVRALDGTLLYGRTPAGFPENVAFADGQTRSVQGDSGLWYVRDVLHFPGGSTGVLVRGMTSKAAADGTIRGMLRLAVIALPFLVLLAAICGYGLVNRAFLPVRQITATAERIGGGTDLSARVGLPGGRDEIYTLAATFDRMFDRLEASFESEKQFTSDASHELRTPTAVILSQCEYALENAQSAEEFRTALCSVQQQAQRMSSLISSLLALARADQKRDMLRFERIDLGELAEMVASEIAEQAAPRHIRVETDIEKPLFVSGDETMLMRMLLNLMENAVKYGRDNGFVCIRLRRDGALIVGTVADDGIGMLPEQAARCFERFYRADAARSTLQPGAGLGLSMARYIAEAHGGHVSVESRFGAGSTFTFTLN